MDVIEAIHKRRSIGRVNGHVDDATLRTLIEAASWAPNHRLTEPWRFTVVRGDAREELGRRWSEVAVRQTPLQGNERDRFLEKERRKPLRAPVLIVSSTRTDPDPVTAEEDFAATAAAVQNLLLAATAHGLATMWRTGAMVQAREVKDFLGLEPSDRIVAIVYIGQPAMEAPFSQRRPVDEITHWITGDPSPSKG